MSLAGTPLAPYCTGTELIDHLGGTIPTQVADDCAYTATMVVWSVVDDPGWDTGADPANPPPAGIHRATLMIAAEVYKAGAAPGGEYQLDAYTVAPMGLTSNLVRKYGALLAPWRSAGSQVG